MANKPNVSNQFLPYHAQDWKQELIPMKASVAMDIGDAIGRDISSNNVTGYSTIMGTENAAGFDFVGILAETIATTDADYATAAKLKTVLVPKHRNAKAYFTVGAGTFTAVDVGKTVEIHSDNKSLAVDTAGLGARITKYISSTRGVCEFSLPNTETA